MIKQSYTHNVVQALLFVLKYNNIFKKSKQKVISRQFNFGGKCLEPLYLKSELQM